MYEMNEKEDKHEELSVFQLARKFPNDLAAEKWFEEIRWPDGQVDCPKCKSKNVQNVRNRKPQPFRCRACRYYFSVRKGSILEATNIGLQTWAYAIYLMTTRPKGISAVQLRKDLGISERSAWYMNHKLREGFSNAAGEPITSFPGGLMYGTVEVDESFFGGKEKNKHADKKTPGGGRGGRGKTIVMGMFARENGHVVAGIIPNLEQGTMVDFIRKYINTGTTVYSDSHKSYQGLDNHEDVTHNQKEYRKGEVHTNNIENFWSIIKRGYLGVYHHMSRKHLQRYLNEFCGRFSIRDMEPLEKMVWLAHGLFGKTIKRKEITAGKRAYSVDR